MKTELTLITLLVVALGILGTPLSLAGSSDDSLEEIFLAQRQHFSRLHSLDLTYTQNVQSGEQIKAEKNTKSPYQYTTRNVTRFQMKEDKFRIENGLPGTYVHPDVEGKERHRYEIKAYNLKHYQVFDKKALLLIATKRAFAMGGYSSLPLLMPYRFITLASGRRYLEVIGDKAVWDKLKKSAKIGETTEIGQYKCIVVDIPMPGRKDFYRVYFAKDLEFYPVRYTYFAGAGHKASEYTVKKVKQYKTPNGNVYIPVLGSDIWFNKTGNKTRIQTCSIDEKSLLINTNIPDKVFTIPVDMANEYYDENNSWNTRTKRLEPAYAMVGKPAPDFTLSKLTGGEITLSEIKADVIVLDFWTTWCGGCINSLPNIQELHNWATEKDNSVAIYTINVKEEPETVAEFLKEKNLDMTVLLDRDRVALTAYKGVGIPHVVIISKGVIKQVHIGGSTDSGQMIKTQKQQLKEEIEALLSKNRTRTQDQPFIKQDP